MFKRIFVILLVFVLSVDSVCASWPTIDKLVASDGALSDYLGFCVSIRGDYAVVGAPLDDDNGSNSGSAYIFKREGMTWSQEDKLTASDGAPDDWFGYCVSISGDYAIVGAYGDDGNGIDYGSAYIFRRDGVVWSQEAKLAASDGASDDFFGVSVSIGEEYVSVGATGDDDNGSAAGSVYIFRREAEVWSEQAKLIASDGAADDWFGYCVSISGDCAIVGAYHDDDNGDDSGSAYIFRRDGVVWSEETKLIASDGAGGDWFGLSVSIGDEYAVVGAHGDDDNGTYSGSAYIFKREGMAWSQEAKLTASDGAAGDWFGRWVSISGDYAIVGAHGDDDNGFNSGSAYMFARCPDSDFTGDCFADFRDFSVLGDAWMSEGGDLNWDEGCDISEPNDNIINGLDLGVFVGEWLEGID